MKRRWRVQLEKYEVEELENSAWNWVKAQEENLQMPGQNLEHLKVHEQAMRGRFVECVEGLLDGAFQMGLEERGGRSKGV